MDEIKRCPFRKDENGDFQPCYGAGCMAYYEYDKPVFHTAATTCLQECIRIPACYRLAVFTPYRGGCA